MTLSRTDTLAMRRRLLVIGPSMQRLKLRRDMGTLAAAAGPAALIRSAWQQPGAQPSLAAATAGLLLVMRLANVGRGWVRARRG